MHSLPSGIAEFEPPVARAKARAGLFDRAILVMAALAVVYTAVSYLGRSFWVLELLTHFRAQAAAGALGLLLIAVGRRRPGTAGLAAAAVAANLFALLPYVVSLSAEASPGAGDVRIMLSNVSKRNSDYARLFAAIDAEQPDIVGLLETDGEWVSELAELGLEYPHSLLRPEDGAYGIALYSRFPLRERADSPYVEDGIQTAIVADVSFPGGTATLILSHLMAPLGGWESDLRNRQIQRLTTMLETDRNAERILLGDLNITPWSPFYGVLERDTGMVNATRGRGYLPTWPADAAILQIPIDHCLLSKGLSASRVRRGADVGSDHLPLIVDVSLAGAWSGTVSAESKTNVSLQGGSHGFR